MNVKRVYISILLILLVFCLGSCGVHNSSKTSLTEEWQGRTRYDLLQAKGIPTQESDDGRDGKILLYESNQLKRIVRVMPNSEHKQVDVLHRVRTQFFLDNTNRIYKVLRRSEPLQ
ncbi:MAG: hypothetical protein AAF740_03500 [Bacteroidota bacterium]